MTLLSVKLLAGFGLCFELCGDANVEYGCGHTCPTACFAAS